MENERRKNFIVNQEHIELLIRIDENLKNLVSNTNNHIESDEVQFTKIHKNQSFTNRIVWMCLGGGIVINFLLRIIHI